ncbi:MAG: HAMP domain-containing histidine kinase [Flavobacteriales bacterium]|nr:HAMP domain-containing histidine kinase [Flavobacteriales bacterium]MCB9193003.1 HAMP domain-containing histidine kinase [Flavobacteriales bacterium]
MRRRSLGTVILLATLSVIGVLLTQMLWLDRAFRLQHEQVELQKQEQQQLEKQFNDRVIIALTNVTEQILSINKDPSDLFDAVKQERPNYFAVTINDTLHPYLLEALLRKEFKRRNITDDFEYGIYDCFTDSIVYGNYVVLDSSTSDTLPHTHLQKLDKDGHYFGVFFPKRSSSLWMPETVSRSTWIYPAIVSMIVFAFFGYSVWIIMGQKRLSEMKNDFIGNMTHELKTPISTIALSSEVISDPAIINEPERLAAYAAIIRSENERLRAQVERVLQLATLDQDKLALKRERIDLHERIRHVVDALKLPLEERQGYVDLHLEAAEHWVTGDPVHLTNVVFNLLDNALKYSDGPPRITIRSSDVGRMLVVAVEDHGIGIRAEDLKHVFERFYRVPTGNVHNVKGFGLGLHYVQQIVNAHGGSIEARSEPGAGSTFTFRLPINKKDRS